MRGKQTVLLYGHDTKPERAGAKPSGSAELLNRALELLTAVPLHRARGWGRSAQGRDCHTNQRWHTGCSVTASDLTQQKNLLFPHRKYQRKKKILRVRHLTSAVQDLKRKVPTTMVQVDLKRTCQLKKQIKCKIKSGSCTQF